MIIKAVSFRTTSWKLFAALGIRFVAWLNGQATFNHTAYTAITKESNNIFEMIFSGPQKISFGKKLSKFKGDYKTHTLITELPDDYDIELNVIKANKMYDWKYSTKQAIASYRFVLRRFKGRGFLWVIPQLLALILFHIFGVLGAVLSKYKNANDNYTFCNAWFAYNMDFLVKDLHSRNYFDNQKLKAECEKLSMFLSHIKENYGGYEDFTPADNFEELERFYQNGEKNSIS